MKRVFVCAVACALIGLILPSLLGAQPGRATASGRIYNTVKQKLAEGKQVIGGTIYLSDVSTYCAMASSGFDFTWIEMQHGTMTYSDAAKMIFACRGNPAIPFLRVPDATEGDIQKATDVGALGIIVPMVESVEKIENAVKFAKYPPLGKRSSGGNQAGAIWGNDYRQTANDNIMIVAMIESPAGVAIADKIAAVPGVDVVFAASGDLSSFSGRAQGDPQYEALVTKIKEATLKAGKKVGGPQSWTNRPDFHFFQGGGEVQFIRSGAQMSLGITPAGRDGAGGRGGTGVQGAPGGARRGGGPIGDPDPH
ncbi:MAG: HpcH/HpaI aldolase/citrate lyase family protein [Bryobacteraceae bacterium]